MNKYHFISPLPLQIFLRTLLWPLYRIFFRHRVQGLEHLKKIEGNFIIASNHIHELDAVTIPVVIPVKDFLKPFFFVSLSKKYYLNRGLRARLFYGGFFFKLVGGYEAYKGVNDFNTSLQNHVRILKNGGVVCIFPEGYIGKPGDEKEAKGGVAFLAHTTRLPIVPIRLEGLWGVSLKDFIKEKKRLKIVIGEPLHYKDLFVENHSYSYEEYKGIAQKILDIIKKIN